MSQYPSPYTPPDDPQPPQGYGYTYPPPQDDPLRPARRAAAIMFVLGGLMFLMGGCFAAIGATGAMDSLPAEQKRAFSQIETQLHASANQIAIAGGIVMLTPGLLMVVLGLFVRRGGIGSIVTSIILTSLMALWMVVNILTAVAHGGLGPQLLLGMLLWAGALVIVILQIVFLFSAARSAGKVRQMRDYAAQYWQQQPPPPPA